MAMRITTKMMQSRSLNNLNTNKALQERLTTQLSTGKKLTRPSDDPVVAIRSLKLNSSLNKVDQYYEKNTKDAKSWLNLTESALSTTSKILEGMRTYVVQAANGPLESKDRQAIVENLSNFRTEIYSTGNADSAGRSIFTGYRTNTPLTIQKDQRDWCAITEQLTNAIMDTTTFVKTSGKDANGDVVYLSDINEGNFLGNETTEYDIESFDIARIRLAYNNLDFDVVNQTAKLDLGFRVNTELTRDANNNMGTALETTNYKMFVESAAGTNGANTLTIHTDKIGADPAQLKDISFAYDATAGTFTVTPTGNDLGDMDFSLKEVTGSDPKKYQLVIKEYKDAADKAANPNDPYKTTTLEFSLEDDGNGNITNKFDEVYETKLTVTDYKESATDDAYLAATEDPNSIVYIAETGELLLGSNIEKQLAALPPTVEIRASYEKTDWKKGDLNPIHYFYTERKDEKTGKDLIYNKELLTDKAKDSAKQIISYDIGSNQTIRVNTTAREVFTHDIGRDVDEILSMLEKYDKILTTQDTVKGMIKSEKYIGDDLDKLTRQKDALDKAASELKDKIEKTTQKMISGFDGYIKQTTLATTDVGSRESRLTLIDNRLGQQQTNFQELVSNNEDADITELAIQLSSVELTYQAALSSISYVMKTSLLDFI